MILNSLYELHKDLAADKEARFFSPDPAFEWREIEWIILISSEGKFIDLISCEIESKGKNTKYKKFLVPRGIERTGGSVPNRPYFLSDHLAYLFDLKIEKTEYKESIFKQQIVNLCEQKIEAIYPVEKFFESSEEKNKLNIEIRKTINAADTKASSKEKDFFKQSFVFAIDYVYKLLLQDQKIIDYWKEKRFEYSDQIRGFKNTKESDQEFLLCSVSNKLISKKQTPFTHEYIRNLGSTKLIYPASSSYNIHKIIEKFDKNKWQQQHENLCSISQEASEKIVDALSFTANFNNEQRVSFKDFKKGSSNYLFWTTKKQREENLISNLIYELGTQENNYTNILPTSYSEVKALLSGKQISNKLKFYLLRLDAKNDGRYSITSWQETALEDIQTNIANYRNQIKCWEPEEERFGEIHIMPVKAYLEALKPSKTYLDREHKKEGSNDDKEANKLAAELTECILFGRRFPDKVLYLALKRLKVESKIKDKDRDPHFNDLQKRRIKLIQVYLLRHYQAMNKEEQANLLPEEQIEKSKEQIEKSLAYKFGRWFAIMEKAQEKSNDRTLNVDIGQKYFAAACSNPLSVFSHLTKMYRKAWLPKLKRDNKQAEEVIAERMRFVCPEIDKALDKSRHNGKFLKMSYASMIEQAEFTLGYHQELKSLDWKLKDRNATEEESKGENE